MRKTLTLFFLCSTCFAREFNPWFSPPFEFKGRTSFFFERDHRVQTPEGSFEERSDDYTAHFSLGVTPWPNWNTEIELFLTHTVDIDFAYRAAQATLRYLWLDDIEGDPITLTTGVTLAFPGDRFLHEFSYPYHGNINAEFHATIGKEKACNGEWVTRLWGYGGIGVANRGSPWTRGMVALEWKTCVELGVFTDGVFGLGGSDIIPDEPFGGYASIGYRFVDIGSYLNYDLCNIGTLSLLGWYNVFARNFVEHSWGVGASLMIPFSL